MIIQIHCLWSLTVDYAGILFPLSVALGTDQEGRVAATELAFTLILDFLPLDIGKGLSQ